MDQAIARLTERQKDCLRLVAQGYTSKEIGRLLAISPATVDNHVRDALGILQVASRAEAARLLAAAEQETPADPGYDQPLISQLSRLAEPLPADPQAGPADSPRRRWRDRLIPPLGGARNSLGPEARLFAIIQVAVLGFASLFILTLGVAAILWLLR